MTNIFKNLLPLTMN